MDNLIVKYLSNSLSAEETGILIEWLQYDENKEKFKKYVRLNHNINLTLQEFDADEALKEIISKIDKPHTTSKLKIFKKRNFYNSLYATAAILLILIGVWSISSLIESGYNRGNITPLAESPITISLEDGEMIAINTKDTVVTDGKHVIASQNAYKRQLNFHKTSSTILSSGIRYLKIPNGKKYTVILEDSTIVYLNSGATLRFPGSFKEQRKREVSLTGEGFFKVYKDEEHPFVVNTDGISVEVLGTSFNVSSYKNSELSEVVLVEGKVNMLINNDDEGTTLNPGYKGAYSKANNFIETVKVDTELYTSWIYGKLVFRNKTLNEILITLERNFNVEIENKNVSLKDEKLNATFNEKESLQRILYYLKEAYNIKYTVEDKKIIIK